MSLDAPSTETPSRPQRARFFPRSLTLRVIAFSTIWAVLALIVIATVIGTLYREASQRGFDSLLSAHLFNLISSVGVSGGNGLTGSPDLGDLRFSRPDSGWYWSVEPVSPELKGSLRSGSMTEAIPSPTPEEIPFNTDFQRSYTTDGLAGEQILVFESEFTLGAGDLIARFRVMGNRTELESDIAAFERRLYTYLALFGAGMIAINAIAILLGLRPLSQVREALRLVRQGTAKRLDGAFPSEISPLANETNALIENNKRIVERARTQVGNLAHSLKTPLAVLLNESRTIGGPKGTLIAEQATAMQKQLDHYLQRARIAAQRDSVVYRTPVGPTLERMVRVMEKLARGKSVRFAQPPEEVLFAGEREDLEEIAGNLLENAMKWGKDTMLVTVVPAADPAFFRMTVEDDGPGIPEDRAREAIQRGRRLDEKTPGTGLGLSIVADLVSEYGGRLALERSDLGGLKAVIELKRAQ